MRSRRRPTFGEARLGGSSDHSDLDDASAFGSRVAIFLPEAVRLMSWERLSFGFGFVATPRRRLSLDHYDRGQLVGEARAELRAAVGH